MRCPGCEASEVSNNDVTQWRYSKNDAKRSATAKMSAWFKKMADFKRGREREREKTMIP